MAKDDIDMFSRADNSTMNRVVSYSEDYFSCVLVDLTSIINTLFIEPTQRIGGKPGMRGVFVNMVYKTVQPY